MQKLNKESISDLTNYQILQLHEHYEKTISTLIELFSADSGADFYFMAFSPFNNFSIQFGLKQNWPDELHECVESLINRLTSEKWLIEEEMENRCNEISGGFFSNPDCFVN